MHHSPSRFRDCCRQRRRRRRTCSCAILDMIAISALYSSIFSIVLLSSRNNNDFNILVSATATGAPSSFIFLLKRRKQNRLVKTPTEEQQRTTVLLDHEGKQDGGMAVMEQKVNGNSNSKGRQIVLTTSSDSANGKSLSNINNGEQVTLHQGILDIPPSNGQVRSPSSQSLMELDLVEDEPYPNSIHPIDNAYARLSQTLEEYDATTSTLQNENTETLLQDMSQSLDSMEGSEDDHVTYIRSISAIDESSSQRERLEKAEVMEEEITDSSSSSSSSSWAKRNARSIDEGVRFKFQLREGLEERSKLHREQLLSDLLEGVIGGTSTALDAEPDVTIMKRNITNPIRLWWSERFGKKESNDESTTATSATSDVKQKEDDDGLTTQTAASEESLDSTTPPDKSSGKSEFYSRTITGLLMALAEEAEGLEVSVDADESTPFWNKTFNSINIHFNRLGFRQLRFGGLDNVLNELEATLAPSEKFSFARGLFKAGGKPTTADEAFDKIDIDNSGSLDEDELAQALKMAAILGGNKFGARSKEMVADMASKLIRLYDTNGDGVVDREEYRVLVQDMTALRDARLREGLPQQTTTSELDSKNQGWFRRRRREVSESSDSIDNESDENIIDITDDENFWESLDHGEGSIVFKDMKLDLRRLLFGLIPGMKRILPGGPLILKPFTATVTASWTREDIMDSFLIDAGLRRLVSRALSRRVRGIRDLFDGAVFYGRTWKLFEQNAPLVEVQKLEDVQFDWRDRLIITGRAKIKASPDAPSIENGFKLRTKIGTRGNGRIIGLLRPEIAIFAECPKKLESTIRTKCKEWFDYTMPRYEPLYTYIPLVSPLKKDDKMDGFNMGPDNQLKSIEIKNGRLCFEFSSVLRPGRFLGNYYMAFTVPNRTLILTLDKVKEGMRNARRNKRLAERAAKEVQQLAEADSAYNAILTEESTGKITSISPEGKLRIRRLENELKATIQDELVLREIEDSGKEPGRSFFSKFVEGYSGAIQEELDIEMNTRLSSSISNFFGSQESIGEENSSGNNK